MAENQVKGVIFTAAQQQLMGMRERGEIRVTAADEALDCLSEKPDAAAWYTLEKLNQWTSQVRDLVGTSKLVDFGWASADKLGETGIYRQFEVTLEEQGFSLGSKLMMSFAGVSHPYTEFTLAKADPDTGVIVEVIGSAGWNDEQCAITLGWVHYLSQKLIPHETRSDWRRLDNGDVQYVIDVI